MSAAALTPRVRTMVICDSVRKSKMEAGVFHLKGVRQGMTARAFPLASELWLFLLLSSPRAGVFPAYVRVANARTDRAVFHANLNPQPEFTLDGQYLTYSTPIRCEFPDEGTYTVQLSFFQAVGIDVLKGEMPFSISLEGD